MKDARELEQFLDDEGLRGTDAFLQEVCAGELEALRDNQHEMFARIAEESAGYLSSSPLRLTSVDEEDGVVTPVTRLSSTMIHVDDRGIRWQGLAGIAAAAMLLLSLTVLISIYSGNGVTKSGNNKLANSTENDSTEVSTQESFSSDIDNAYALSFNAIERDLEQMQDNFDALGNIEDTNDEASSLDDAMNRLAMDMDTF